MNEVWKSIPGADGCMVSDMGRIRDKSGRIKPQDTDLEGYRRVSIKIEGRPLHLRVHTIVASVFIPNPYNKPFVNHINGIKGDNTVSNLEYCTPRENSLLASKNGQLNTGRKREIIAVNLSTGEKKSFESQFQAAKEIGCHNSEINKCLHGKRMSSHGYKFYYANDYEGDKSFLQEQYNRQLSLFDLENWDKGGGS
jgi:hypothetical protein